MLREKYKLNCAIYTTIQSYLKDFCSTICCQSPECRIYSMLGEISVLKCSFHVTEVSVEGHVTEFPLTVYISLYTSIQWLNFKFQYNNLFV